MTKLTEAISAMNVSKTTDIEAEVLSYLDQAMELSEAEAVTISVDDLSKKLKEVGSNKKNLLFLIGNGINRLKNQQNNRGVILLTAAIAILGAAGDDSSLINLAKRIAYTGLSGR